MLQFDVHTKPIDTSAFSAACSKAEEALAIEVMKDTDKYVPALERNLSKLTRVEGSVIVYPGPYARYLYYGKVMVDKATGQGAFYIKDVGFRFHTGAVLTATERDLVFTKTVHPKAQAHWFEASKAQNLAKWERVSKKLVEKYGTK